MSNENSLDFMKDCIQKGAWRSFGDNTVKHTKDVISNVLKNKGADDGTIQFIGEFLDSKEGEAIVAALLAALLHFGPEYIPMVPDQIKTDPRIKRLAKEYGVKAGAEGMNVVYNELQQIVIPIFSKLMLDMQKLPKTRVEEEEEMKVENDKEEEECKKSPTIRTNS